MKRKRAVWFAGVILVLILGFVFYRERNLMDIEDQMEIFAECVNEWSDITGYFCFTIGDLNQDKKLELIVSTIQGSADFAYTDYYVIKDKKAELVRMQKRKKRDSSALIHDFLNGKYMDHGITNVEAYYDEQNGIYYYIHHDYSGHTPYEAYDGIIGLSLQDGIICEDILAYKKIETTKPYGSDVTVSYIDDEQNEISEMEYEKIPEHTYMGCEKMEMRWQWHRIDRKEDIRNMDKKELQKLLMDTYNNFQMNNQMG